jgi:hypothetical protein
VAEGATDAGQAAKDAGSKVADTAKTAAADVQKVVTPHP